MKALRCKRPGNISDLTFEEHTLREIEKDEVLIGVRYSGVNFPDILIAEGRYQFSPTVPFVPGGEVAGEVIKIGSEVAGLRIGDPVIAGMGWGGFAGKAIAKASNTFNVESMTSLRQGCALLETYATALHALRDRGVIQAGEKLLVLGAAGGTGTAAIEIGKVIGAHVIAAASNEEKLAFARESGADQVINSNDSNLKTKLKEWGGVDLVFDPVGGNISEQAFRSLNPSGRHLVVGFASGEIPSLPWNLPLLKSAAIVGVFWGSFWRNLPDENRKNVELLIQWMKQGKIRPRITREYDLKDGVKALESIKNRKVMGKLVLKV